MAPSDSMSPGRAKANTFRGGGEMGAMMRAFDWSKTALGPTSTWPQSLCTAVSIVLDSKFPMYIAWGPSYVQLYNDFYRPILGSTKHPAALGLSTRETFAEVWDIIGPMFDGVMQGTAVGFNDFLLPLDRHGFVEECYFVFSYSPIRDESGDAGGVLVTVTETTDRVLGERRVRTLRELSSQTAAAESAEAALAVAAKVLSGNPSDLPFALVYLVDDQGDTAHLAGTAGLLDATLANPSIPLTDPGSPWRLGTLRSELRPVECALANGQRALVLPLQKAGEAGLSGILVAGLSPKLRLDDSYKGFLDLLASQLAKAVSNARAMQETKKRAAALAEIDRAKTAFFSNISHEFRTPLTLLLGPAQDALAQAGTLPPDDLERWRLVHGNGLRLLRLVNALLDFSRIEAGRMRAHCAPTDLGTLTADLASQFRSAFEKAGLSFTVKAEPSAEPVYVDRRMWENIVLNLLSNALKFTFTGGIEVELHHAPMQIQLVVRDTGIGIAETELPYLFDRFHRVEGAKSRTHEGTGIGLALVKELVQLHGGTVRVASALHRGSTFVVTVPRGSADAGAEIAAAAPSPVESAASFLYEARGLLEPAAHAAPVPAGDHPRGRVLLADDNADMRNYVARILGDAFDVTTVRDGAAALAEARRQAPDLVLTDVMMPVMDGYALLRALRADPSLRAVPVVLLSARSGEEARVEGLHQGADDYLGKPFSALELVARVRTHLDLSRFRRASEHARERLYDQFMQAPVPVAVLSGEDLAFEIANAQYEQMVGKQGLAGKRFLDAFPELNEDAPVVRMIQTVRRTGEPFIAEEYCVPLDPLGTGQLQDTYFKFTCQPLRDAFESITGVMAIAVDVTAQVRARRELAAQNRISETLNRISAALNAELDLPRILEKLTDEATALCRAEIGAFLVPESAAAGFPLPPDTTIFAPTFAGEAIVRSDDILQDPRYGKSAPPQGTQTRPWPVRSYLAVPVKDTRGKVLGGLFFGHAMPGAFTAADEQILHAVATQAATALQNGRLYEQARLAEQRTAYLQAITAKLSFAISQETAAATLIEATLPVVDATVGVVLLLSDDRRVLRRFASSQGAAQEALAVVQEIGIDSSLPAAEAVRTGGVVWLATTEEIRARNPELDAMRSALGAQAWGAVPLIFEGRTFGVLTVTCDKERFLSTADLNFLLAAGSQCAQAIERARLFEAAQQANRAKDEFLAMLGHELRNPLAPIQTALQLMRLRGEAAWVRERAIIERQVNHVVRLVEDLMDVSRITRGKVELRRQPVQLAEVIARAVEMASPLIEEKQHQLHVSVPATGLLVDADAVRLSQVFSNLLNNAAKYTPVGGRIELTAAREDDELEIRVSDNGMGLTEELLPHVFELFVQARQSVDRAQGGLGLGLSIVRSLVLLHGGGVKATSPGPGRGSTFVIHLPAYDPTTAAAGSDRVEPAPVAPPSEILRILVVDDNADAAELLGESLEMQGFVVSVATDPVQALQRVASFQPEVALLDIGLPVMDGYELGARLKALVPGIRLVALTGYGQDSDRQKSAEQGFHAHLVKPISTEQVLGALRVPPNPAR